MPVNLRIKKYLLFSITFCAQFRRFFSICSINFPFFELNNLYPQFFKFLTLRQFSLNSLSEFIKENRFVKVDHYVMEPSLLYLHLMKGLVWRTN